MGEAERPRVMPAPLSMDLAITGRCNLHCKYCFYADEMASLADLPTDRWLAFFEELGSLAVQRVTLTGGEVFTRPDLFELIDGIVASRMRYNILSNGTLITETLLAQFDRGKRRLRLDSIQVSIDGSRAEIHNKSRPGSFDRALHGLRLLMERAFPTTVRVTINQHNVDDLPAIARLLLEEIGLPSFSTNEAFPCSIVETGSHEIILSPAQRLQAMEILTKLSRYYDGRINAQAGPLALARYFREMDERLEAGETSMPGRGRLVGCGGMWNKMAVLHDGTLVPCHNLSSLHMGTIGLDSLHSIWHNHPTMRALRQRHELSLQTLETCHDCPYRGFCTGGCPAGALFLTGEVNARNPMDCYRVHRGEDRYFVLPE